MSDIMRFCLAQVNPTVADMVANSRLIVETVHAAEKEGAVAVVFPELVLTGYIPEDWLLRPAFLEQVRRVRTDLCAQLKDSTIWALIGYPRSGAEGVTNTLGVLHRGEWVAEYHKWCLPNYQVFDEKRYFVAGRKAQICDIAGVAVGLSVCEDIWHPEPAAALVAEGAQLIVNTSASPFACDRHGERVRQARMRVEETGLPVVYVTAVGGQDELVFDGGSFALDRDGKMMMQAERFQTGLYTVELNATTQGVQVRSGHTAPRLSRTEAVYRALLLGLSDYVRKNAFERVLLGVSGGIDSSLCMAIAVDALGADAVSAVMMPSRYTADISITASKKQARTSGVRLLNIGIDALCRAFGEALAPAFAGTKPDATEENIQARCRGTLLMALSNKYNGLLLSTGNKSELAVGYATLYGDMAGGFNPLKDVPKTLVYELARYRNTLSPVIPQEVIERAPSAELRPDQKDSDTLPPYEVLDAIVERYVERNEDASAIIAAGLDAKTVRTVIARIEANEYKRQQAAIGTRISTCSFSRRDRRYPISSGWDGTLAG